MAFELRRQRQEAGLSQADVAKVLDCQVPKVSLTEKGQRNVQEDDLHKLLELYQVPEDRRQHYITAARNMRKKGWWERYGQHTMPPWLEPYVGLEQGAERLRAYQPSIIYGLLQTPEYAAAVLRRTVPATSSERVDRLVELRMQRQQALWRATDPLRLSVVMDEAALRRVVGGDEIMHAQLERIVDVAGEHRHITVQIVPFGRGAYETTYGPFSILSFPWPTDRKGVYDPGLVYVELRTRAEYLDAVPDIDLHSQVFEQLCSLALPPDESVDMIRNVAEDYKT
jgi:transcriptional regulator with XRE-family HTH domain